MPKSMTGYGHAGVSDRDWSADVVVRSVNGKHLKTRIHLDVPMPVVEEEIGALVARRMTRGTVDVSVRLDWSGAGAAAFNPRVIAAYVRSLERLRRELGLAGEVRADQVALLPGAMAAEGISGPVARNVLRRLRPVAVAALEAADRMRASEGRHLAVALRDSCTTMRALLRRVEKRLPRAAADYRDRLTRRVAALLQNAGGSLEPGPLAREIILHGERADIAEELCRMKAHITHFLEALRRDGTGRKLEFIAQEMLRESNTMSSKASDAKMTEWIIDLRAEVDRIREQVQNLE